MKITLVAVGKPGRPLRAAIQTYEERAKRYWKLETSEIRSVKAGRPEDVMAREGERILERIPSDAELWSLTREGRRMTSTGLSSHLESRALASSPGITFVIGGAFGLGDSVLSHSVHRLSLSSMTLPHDLARLILVEQLYRAGTIRRKEPYHKGP